VPLVKDPLLPTPAAGPCTPAEGTLER
jgi:hypothetical protein